MNKNISLSLQDFVPGKPGEPVLNLDTFSSSEIDPLISQIQNALFLERSLVDLVGRRDVNLQERLKESIISFLNLGSQLDSSNIVFGFGSYSILERIAWKLLRLGTMIGHLPQFRYFPMEYLRRGGRYLGCREESFELPAKNLSKEIEDSAVECVYINNPVNPTGQVWEKRVILDLVERAGRRGVITIVDEVYGDLLDASSSLGAYVSDFPNLIVLRSFSKIFGLQNLRVGYMIAGRELMDQYLEIRDWDEITNVGALFARSILENEGYLAKLRQECKEAKPLFEKCLIAKGFKVLPGDPLVPLLYFSGPGGADLGEYFRSRNIKVEGSSTLRVLDKGFPLNYARIRVPGEERTVEELRKILA